jgi:hypothetical protein
LLGHHVLALRFLRGGLDGLEIRRGGLDLAFAGPPDFGALVEFFQAILDARRF